MKYALRQLAKNPGFTAVALLTLALGIGVNTTTFSLVNALLFRLPPFPDPGRIVEIYATTPQNPQQNLSPANVHDILAAVTSYGPAAAYTNSVCNLAHPGEPANRVSGLQVGGDFFAVLAASPLLGRTLTPADDRPGHNNVVVVSERFWRENLGGRPDALGTQLRVDAKPATVVGVMPAGAQDFISWGPVDLWQPLGYDSWADRANSWLTIIARLKPGVSVAAARGELATIGGRLAHDFPVVNAGQGLTALPYVEARRRGSTLISGVLMGLMVAVLLIACVNLANLQLARTAGRMREHAVRIALGATRGQLIRQLLAESVLLSVSGGALGLLVALWGNRLLGSRIQMGPDAPGFDLPLDPRVLAFTLAASVLTGVLFGIMPAWIAAGTDVNAGLKQGGRGSPGDRRKHRMRQALVVGELALALALLAGAGFFVRGVQRLQRTDIGWPTADLVDGNVVLPWSSYSNNDQMRATIGRMETRLAALPGVDHAAVAGSIPVFGFPGASAFAIEGQAPPPAGGQPLLLTDRVSADFFATLGIRLLSGRAFTAADRADSKAVIIIDRTMAEKFWPRGDALGHRIAEFDAQKKQQPWREIVGIVSDVHFIADGYAGGSQLQSYHPIAQDPDHWLSFALHSRSYSPSLLGAARRAIAEVDPDLAVYNLSTVDARIEQSAHNEVLVGQLLSVAALLGLLLALVGIYGVIANLALQRTQEIGIRMALGAQGRDVLWLILRNGAKLAAAGTAAGLLLAFALVRGLGAAMPEMPGQDPLLLGILALLLAAATLLASWVPARRATRIDPIIALREN